MTADSVLSLVKDAGLILSLNSDGVPLLTGPRERITPTILESLREHREGILAKLRPAATRRVVLLTSDRDSSVERVLAECTPADQAGKTRQLAAQHPGRTVAAEWLQTVVGEVGSRWIRYLWISFPIVEKPCASVSA